MRTYQGTVFPTEIDHMGHMNVRFYMEKFDQATWNFFLQCGMSKAYFDDEERGMPDSELLAEMKMTAVHLDRKLRKAVAFPEEVVAICGKM